MAELTINGHSVTVDDSFNNLSPEQQEATVNEIAASLGPQKQEAAPSLKRQFGAFVTGAGEAIPFAQDVAAGLKAGASYLPGHEAEGTFGERFSKEKRRQMEASRILGEEYPLTHGAGVVSGIGAGLAAPEASLVKAGMTLPAKVLAGSTEAALYGLGQGVTPEERLHNAVTGAGIGAGVTGGIGAAEKALSAAQAGAKSLMRTPYQRAAEMAKPALETDVRRASDMLTPEEIKGAVSRGQPILPVDVGGYTLAGELRKEIGRAHV